MTFTQTFIAAATLAFVAGTAQATATAEEAKQLGSTLTPWGADKAANKDGSIPAYTGGLSPSEGPKGSGRVADLFTGDKPQMTIDAKNMAQYADKLTPGTQELLKRWPTFHLEVYQTRRTYPAMSKERADNSIKNATNPECKTVGEGTGLRGCWDGVPFPIPKNGFEAMWNHHTHERPLAYEFRQSNWLVDASGTPTLTNLSTSYTEYPYWDAKEKPYVGAGMYYQRITNLTSSPARDAGQKTMIWFPLDFDTETSRIWSYTTGQRRTRLAPELTYDTPSAQLGGALNYDEIGGGFAGRMDRFDFKIVGKKEMYVPYNNLHLFNLPPEKVLGKQHINSDVTRWELHRVWVIEATRKAGKRHIAAKRTFYLDEDSWSLLATEAVDDSGKIFRVGIAHTGPSPDGPGIVDFASAGAFYDLTKGQYIAISLGDSKPGLYKIVPRVPDSQMTPDALAGSGVR